MAVGEKAPNLDHLRKLPVADRSTVPSHVWYPWSVCAESPWHCLRTSTTRKYGSSSIDLTSTTISGYVNLWIKWGRATAINNFELLAAAAERVRLARNSAHISRVRKPLVAEPGKPTERLCPLSQRKKKGRERRKEKLHFRAQRETQPHLTSQWLSLKDWVEQYRIASN